LRRAGIKGSEPSRTEVDLPILIQAVETPAIVKLEPGVIGNYFLYTASLGKEVLSGVIVHVNLVNHEWLSYWLLGAA
jgi:hypothetical protein